MITRRHARSMPWEAGLERSRPWHRLGLGSALKPRGRRSRAPEDIGSGAPRGRGARTGQCRDGKWAGGCQGRVGNRR